MSLISILPSGPPNSFSSAMPMSKSGSSSGGGGSKIEAVPAILVPFSMDELGGPLAPIKETGGLVFQYSPSITETISVQYNSSGDIVHSNEQYQVYKQTNNREISLDSIVFTADTEENARYLLAAIHFFRVYSLMDFGRGKTGKPPSPMWFSAYGGLAFDRVPVLLSGASITWSKDVDYVYVTSSGTGSGKPQTKESSAVSRVADRFAGSPDAPLLESNRVNLKKIPSTGSTSSDSSSSIPGLGGGDSDSAWVPMKIEISGIKLTVQHTPAYWKNIFSLADFYAGGMVESRETSTPSNSSAGSGDPNTDQTPDTTSGAGEAGAAPAAAPAAAKPASKPVVPPAPPKPLSGGLTRLEAQKARERLGIKSTDSRQEVQRKQAEAQKRYAGKP